MKSQSSSKLEAAQALPGRGKDGA